MEVVPSQTTRVTLPYVNNVSEATARLLAPYNVRVAHKPNQTLRSCVMRPKDPLPTLEKSGVVYKIHCNNCPSSYVGETSKRVKTRIQEHKLAIRRGEQYSQMLTHMMESGHSFDFEGVQVIANDITKSGRLLKEAWLSCEGSINRHIDLRPAHLALRAWEVHTRSPWDGRSNDHSPIPPPRRTDTRASNNQRSETLPTLRMEMHPPCMRQPNNLRDLTPVVLNTSPTCMEAPATVDFPTHPSGMHSHPYRAAELPQDRRMMTHGFNPPPYSLRSKKATPPAVAWEESACELPASGAIIHPRTAASRVTKKKGVPIGCQLDRVLKQSPRGASATPFSGRQELRTGSPKGIGIVTRKKQGGD